MDSSTNMASGVGIIREQFLDLASSLDQGVRKLILRILGEAGDQLMISPDDQIHSLLADFAEHGRMTLEEAASCWLRLQAHEYQQDQEVKQLWEGLTNREQQVVALCCLEYSDREIAGLLDIAYGTVRTHLYNAIYKLGISKKAELRFLLRNWDFSKFDRDF